MSRRLKIVLAVSLVLTALIGAGLWALPEVVRRVAVAKIPELTGRATSIEDVDLNLFTGRFAVKKLRMARRPGRGKEAFVEFDRLDGRVALSALLRSDIRVAELRLSRPAVRFTRTGPFDFDFSDLLRLFVRPVTKEEPSRWTFSIGRFDLTGGAIVVDDAFLSPPEQWRVEDLGVEVAELTTAPGRPPGHLRLEARLGETRLRANSRSVTLTPFNASLDVSLSDFDLIRVRRYLPPDLPAAPEAGKVGFALRLDRVRTGDELAQSSLSGEVRLEALSLVQRDRTVPFFRADRLTVGIKQMDFLAKNVVLGSVDLDGFDLKARRDKQGEIDPLAALRKPGTAETEAAVGVPVPSAGPPPAGTPDSPMAPRAPPSAAPAVVKLERLSLKSGAITVTDEAVSPSREWKVDGIEIDGAGFSTSADDPPATLRLRAQVTGRPGSAKAAGLAVDADAIKLAPPGVSARVVLDAFAIAALEPYWPPTLPAAVKDGSVGLTLALGVEHGQAGLGRATASGSVRLERLSVLQRDRTVPFFRARRLTVGIEQIDLLAKSVVLGSVDLDGFDLKAGRDKQGEIDLLAALRTPGTAEAEAAVGAPVPSGGPPPVNMVGSPTPPRAPPSAAPAVVKLERLSLKSGAVTVTDEAVSPSREWKVDGIAIDGAGFSTSAKDPPATLRLRAQVTGRPGSAKAAGLAVDADAIRLAPPSVSARVVLDAFAIAALEPYWPPTLPAVVKDGSVGLTLALGVEQGQAGLGRATASGSVRLDELAVVQRDEAAPFLKVPKLAVDIKQVDAVARAIDIGTIEIEGADLLAVREAAGRIGLLDLIAPAGPAIEEVKSRSGVNLETAAAAPPPARTPPAAAQWRLSLDRFLFSKGTLTFEDAQVTPPATLTLGDANVTAEHITWPFTQPGTFSFVVLMPGGGWTYGKGTAVLEPLNLQVALSTRETPIDPYQTYFPFAARLGGFFNGDSLSEVQRGPNGELILASRGTAWANEVQVQAPGEADPVVFMDSLVIRNVDFSWPNYALVEKVALLRPKVRVERDEQGQINLRHLFEARKSGEEKTASAPPPAQSAPAPPAPPAGGSGAGDAEPGKGGGLMQNMVIDFTEIEMRNGFTRFIDRTVSPPFSESISRLALKINNLSNVLGRPERTTMTVQALVGTDGALDMRGNLSGLGETLRGDLVAELRDFSLAGASPYAESVTSWAVQRGTLQAKIHYQIEGDRITADHDLVLKGLRVEKAQASDEAKRRIGIPLGLAVALLKDSHGDIDFSLPLTGTLSDRQFNWGDAMWAAAKQVITKVLLSPFRAIGRLFTDGDDAVDKLEINPVTFAPGSAVIAPSLEAQITRVAEFLRRSPYIKLALAPVVTTADVDSLRTREVRRRLEAFRREQSLPDQAGALRQYYQQRLPNVPLPKTPEEQVALLVEREPVPERGVTELVARRLEAVRDDLVKARDIPADRVLAPPAPPSPPPAPAAGEGRVEFTIVDAQP